MVLRVLLLSWLIPSFMYARQIRTWQNSQGTLVSAGSFIVLPFLQHQRLLWSQQIPYREAYFVQCISLVLIASWSCSCFLGWCGNHIDQVFSSSLFLTSCLVNLGDYLPFSVSTLWWLKFYNWNFHVHAWKNQGCHKSSEETKYQF